MTKQQIIDFLETVADDPELKSAVAESLTNILGLRENPFHPLVSINGEPTIGKNVYIGMFSEVNAKGSTVTIGDNCDIASFVSINVADSHMKAIGSGDTIERMPITLEENVFVGSHSFIGGDTHIGHHSIVGAGTIILKGGIIPPYSLIIGNPFRIKESYFEKLKK